MSVHERKKKEASRGRKLALSHGWPSFFNGALCAPSGLLRSLPVNREPRCRCNSGTLPDLLDFSVPQMAGSGVEPPPQREFEGSALNVLSPSNLSAAPVPIINPAD